MTLLERKLSLPDRPRKTTLSANDGRTLTSVMCHPWPLDRGNKASLAATSGLKDSVRSGWNAASSAIDWQLPGGVFCSILEQEHMRGYTFTWLMTYSRIQHLKRIFNIVYANKLLGNRRIFKYFELDRIMVFLIEVPPGFHHLWHHTFAESSCGPKNMPT